MVGLCSKVTEVFSGALALLWAMDFAPTMGRSGFTIITFNSFQKIERGKKSPFWFNNNAAYTL